MELDFFRSTDQELYEKARTIIKEEGNSEIRAYKLEPNGNVYNIVHEISYTFDYAEKEIPRDHGKNKLKIR